MAPQASPTDSFTTGSLSRVAVDVGSGIERPPGATQYLIADRVIVNIGRWLPGRVLAGLSYARSRDPALDSGMPATDRALAVNTLGRTLVPFGDKRVTHLAGADLTLARGPIWARNAVPAVTRDSGSIRTSMRRQNIGSLGFNAATARVRWSAFVSAIRFEDATTRESQHAGELAFRAVALF